MILKTFWIWHVNEEGPACEAAWDTETFAEHPEGWETVKADVRARYGRSIHSEREIEVRLDYDAVLKHWFPDPVIGDVA